MTKRVSYFTCPEGYGHAVVRRVEWPNRPGWQSVEAWFRTRTEAETRLVELEALEAASSDVVRVAIVAGRAESPFVSLSELDDTA